MKPVQWETVMPDEALAECVEGTGPNVAEDDTRCAEHEFQIVAMVPDFDLSLVGLAVFFGAVNPAVPVLFTLVLTRSGN